MRNIRILGFLFLVLSIPSGSVIAQSYSGDARKIGMGGIGYSENITAEIIENERQYSSIIAPLGLIQLLQDLDRFDPDDDHFDPILAMEYASNPLHYIFDRDPGGPRGRFVDDLVNGTLDRDLNAYRGFVPTNNLLAEGLANPNWGKTFKFKKNFNGSYQGIYAGAGPYISAKTDLYIDKGLTDILSSESPVYLPNRNYLITDKSVGQLALAVTGGYRARFALPGQRSEGKTTRNGIYFGINYNYLFGFQYGDVDIDVRFDTDSAGLISLQPETAPVVLDYYHSHSGRGFAFDFGVGTVINDWEFGFGANGVGNRINWHNLTRKQFRLESLLDGGDYIEEPLPVTSGDSIVKLPVEYIGNVGYHRGKWAALAEVSHGFQGAGFHGGIEYRLKYIEFRGGGRYGLNRWHPSGGLGFNLGEQFSVDIAAFGTTTNIERQLKPGIAISFRINKPSV